LEAVDRVRARPREIMKVALNGSAVHFRLGTSALAALAFAVAFAQGRSVGQTPSRACPHAVAAC
jgi:hypothetical protein